MGHRALVLYQTGEQTFNAHYSHWGAHDLELCQLITAETPLGGDNSAIAPPVGAFVEALAESTGADESEVETNPEAEGEGRAVNPDPIATNVTIAKALHDTIEEFWAEAVFVVTPGEDGVLDVDGFHALRDMTGEVLLIEPDWWEDGSPRGLSYDEGWFRGLRDAHESMSEDGLLDETEANERLLAAVLERYEEALSKRAFAHSPALTERHLQEHPEAFIKMLGRSRVLGEMYPSGVREVEPWELPGTFPEITTADGGTINLV